MRKVSKLIFFFSAVAFYTVPVIAQYTFVKEKEGFAIEVSLSNTKLKRIPAYCNSISSLAVIGDQIIGGTTANEKYSPYVFIASLSKKEMTGLKNVNEVIPGQRAISTGYFRGKNNALYAGTIANKINDTTYGTGHLIQVNANADGTCVITDLGTPVEGEGVFALTCDTSKGILYGLSYPSGIFFKYTIANRQVKKYDNIVPSAEDKDLYREFSIKPANYLSRALVMDNQGLIYGSRPVNSLFVFNPSTDSFTALKDILPEVWGRRALGQIDAWVKSPDGRIYGSNAGDGQLFELQTSDRTIRNLGKPVMMNRIRGLSFGSDGKLYGIAGAPPGYAHFFSYDAAKEGFRDYGNLQFIMQIPGIEGGIEWRGFQLGAVASTEDGKFIVMGEDESLSQLLIFPVGN